MTAYAIQRTPAASTTTLAATSTFCAYAYVQATPANTGVITIGDATGQYLVVSETDYLRIGPCDLNAVTVKGTVAGDKVNVLYFI